MRQKSIKQLLIYFYLFCTHFHLNLPFKRCIPLLLFVSHSKIFRYLAQCERPIDRSLRVKKYRKRYVVSIEKNIFPQVVSIYYTHLIFKLGFSAYFFTKKIDLPYKIFLWNHQFVQRSSPEVRNGRLLSSLCPEVSTTDIQRSHRSRRYSYDDEKRP